MQLVSNKPTRRFARPLRFGLVGASGIVVNSIILWLLARELRLSVPLASALATEVAILCNFMLNDRWTFRGAGHDRRLAHRLARYNSVALVGLAITAGLLTLLVDGLHIALLAANPVAIGAATVWNYVASSRWTWKPSGVRSQESGGSSQQSASNREALLNTDYFLLTTADEEVAL